MSYENAVRLIASKVALYVEYVWPRLEKRGGMPETPANRKERGESSPAIPLKGLDVVDDNRIPSRYLRFFLEETENGSVKAKNGVYFSEVLKDIRYDPGCLANWRAAKSDEDMRMLQAFRECIRHVAKGVVFVYGEKAAEDGDFRVIVNPRDEQLKTFEQGRARDGGDAKTYNAQSRYPKLVREVDEIKEREGCKLEEALEIWNEARPKRENVSPRTLYNARAYVKGQVIEGRDGTIGYSRMVDEEAS
jgi:hypothetical protein